MNRSPAPTHPAAVPAAPSRATEAEVSVALFFRCPAPGFHSMEEQFGIVTGAFPASLRWARVAVPEAGAGLRAIRRNCRYARRRRAPVNHITGHVHYLAPALGRNTVLTVHDIGSSLSGRFTRDLPIRILWYWLPALTVRRITVISEFSRRELLRLVPFAGKKIRVIPVPAHPGLKPRTGEFRSACPRILHLGTKPNKNLERLAEALRGIPCVLTVIGPLRNEQKQCLAENGIRWQNRVDIPFSEIIREYEACDLVAFASTYEGFGMPIIEAQAVGRPVLAGRVASMPEVAGSGALLVDPFDVDDIRRGLLRIIREPGLRDRLIGEGFRNVERFRPERIAGEYLRLYEEIAGRPL